MKFKDKKGFTVIELMVVVAIIGIAASIAIPSYLMYLPHLRLKAAARDISTCLNMARMKAIAMNTSKKVTFDEAAESYSNNFKADLSADVTFTSANRDWKDANSVDIRFPLGGGTKYTEAPSLPNPKEVVYSSYGVPTNLPNANTDYAIYLQNNPATGEEYRVKVNRLTGQVTVGKWNGVDKWE